jgi:hypothetical protein
VSEWSITEEQLYSINTVIQRVDHVLLRNVMTRTAQESALFPVMQNINLAFNEAYFRYPDLLRESMQLISPEQVGHQCRERSTTLTRMRAFSTLDFYLLGRENLLRLGLLRPEDNLEDLWLVCDWWQRFVRSFTREYAHSFAMDAGDIAPYHPERVLQVFEADAFACANDNRLRTAATKFLAAATQYNFLAHCESRLGQQGAGPYSLGQDVLLHVRDFTNLGECDFSWLDDVATGLEFNNLSVVILTKAVAVDITDFGSTFTTPEDYQSRIIGVGLYTSDLLTEGYEPVGMGSARELADTFEELAAACNEAIGKLYKRIADMSATQLIDAGLFVNFQLPVAVTQMAGTFRHADWEYVDRRNDRLRPIYNEEFAMDVWLENQGLLLGAHGGSHEYYLHPEFYNVWRKRGRQDGTPLPAGGRQALLVPAGVLIDHDYPRRVNPSGRLDCAGSASLPPKTGRWCTSQGRLNEADLNARALSFRPKATQEPWVYLDDQWVKYHWRDGEVEELYRHTQESSRMLRGAGSGLVRADIRYLREKAGDPPWTAVDH